MVIDINTFKSTPVQQPVVTKPTETNQKNESKIGTTTKVAIGTGLAALAAVGIYIATKGKVSKPSSKLVEHIDFKEANSLEDALKFAKEKLGIRYHGDIKDIGLVNFVNEWAVKLKNNSKKTNSNLYPKFVGYTKDEISAPFAAGIGTIKVGNSEGYVLGVNKNTFEHFNELLSEIIPADDGLIFRNSKGEYQIGDEKFNTEFVHNLVDNLNSVDSKTSFKEKVKILTDIHSLESVNIVNGKIKEDSHSLYSMLNHELGHMKHQECVSNITEMQKIKDFQYLGEEVSGITKEFTSDKTIQNIASKVSSYAKESPLEFVAETFSQLCDGRKFDDDVMALYKKYNGPNL